MTDQTTDPAIGTPISTDAALARLPNRPQIGVFRDSLLRDGSQPFHTWWSREDVEFALGAFAVGTTDRIAGHPLTIRDGGGLLYLEATA